MASLAIGTRLGRRLRLLDVCRPLVEEARGLEIGGPSAIFARTGLLPLYPLLARLDNCDFAGLTIWHGDAADGTPVSPTTTSRPPGTTIRPGRDLTGRNRRCLVRRRPLVAHARARREPAARARRVEAHPRRRRPPRPRLAAPREHLRPHAAGDDPRAPRGRLRSARLGEDDDTHLREFIELCDLSRVPEQLSRQAFEQRTRESVENRTAPPPRLRHGSRRPAARSRGLSAPRGRDRAAVSHRRRCSSERTEPDNGVFLAPTAGWRRESVFRRDRATSPPARGRRQPRAVRRRPGSSIV